MSRHLQEVNTNYFQHCRRALHLAFMSLSASALFAVHAFLPDMFPGAGRAIVDQMCVICLENRALEPVHAVEHIAGQIEKEITELKEGEYSASQQDDNQ